MRLRPNTLVVFEGLDATGKSTQVDMMDALFPDDVVVHSPSGGGPLGEIIYAMTERPSMLPLTRQFLHLAAHAELYQNVILPALGDGRGVFMDRNWWSTLAYWLTEPITAPMVPSPLLLDVVQWPTQGREPDLVFLFMHEYSDDAHNTGLVQEQYWALARRYDPLLVPSGTVREVTDYIVDMLVKSGVVDE